MTVFCLGLDISPFYQVSKCTQRNGISLLERIQLVAYIKHNISDNNYIVGGYIPVRCYLSYLGIVSGFAATVIR
jgi:hypothetical protein